MWFSILFLLLAAFVIFLGFKTGWDAKKMWALGLSIVIAGGNWLFDLIGSWGGGAPTP